MILEVRFFICELCVNRLSNYKDNKTKSKLTLITILMTLRRIDAALGEDNLEMDEVVLLALGYLY